MIITFWIVAINILVITFFKYKEIDRLNKEAELYSYIKSDKPEYKLPAHIKVAKRYIGDSNFRFFGVYGGKFVYFKNGYVKKDMNRFVLTLLLWEFSLSFLLILMVYAVLKHYLKKEQENRRFLKFLLGTISHKMGNFLSIQRVNLELIDADDKKPIERLKDAYAFMERDFKNIVHVIKNMQENKSQKCNAEDVIRDTFNLFKEKCENKTIDLKLQKAYVNSKSGDFYNVIHELIENSVKYSNKFIHMETIKKGRMLYIVIDNDITEKKSGSGFGLSLVRYISSKNRWNFSTKIVDNRFQAALIIRI